MTLNGEMALILHYFTEFVYDVVVKQLLVLPRFQNILLIANVSPGFLHMYLWSTLTLWQFLAE